MRIGTPSSTILAGSTFFALTLSLTGSGRLAIPALTVFFVAGALVLSRVDVERGRGAARAAGQAA